MDSKKDGKQAVSIPNSGYMTDKDIANWLRRTDHVNVRRSLIEMGVEHKDICQVYVFNLESFNKIFWGDQ